MEDTILYAAAFDANGGLFEPLFSKGDVLFSDALNHASIIDGVRLCKAERVQYKHDDMQDLEEYLKDITNSSEGGAQEIPYGSFGKRLPNVDSSGQKVIITDGVFSMDGTVAKLPEIVHLAEKYEAIVVVDECHATGFMGEKGRGTHEHCGVMGRVDVITGTLGKALGGANGGFTSGPRALIEILRQRSRPYLFSNALAPVILGASLAAMELVSETADLRDRLHSNAAYLREGLSQTGIDLIPGEHPIVPVMLYDSALSQKVARDLLDAGIYGVGFFYPVVPEGKARIRLQVSALHTKEHLHRTIEAFAVLAKKYSLCSQEGK